MLLDISESPKYKIKFSKIIREDGNMISKIVTKDNDKIILDLGNVTIKSVKPKSNSIVLLIDNFNKAKHSFLTTLDDAIINFSNGQCDSIFGKKISMFQLNKIYKPLTNNVGELTVSYDNASYSMKDKGKSGNCQIYLRNIEFTENSIQNNLRIRNLNISSNEKPKNKNKKVEESTSIYELDDSDSEEELKFNSNSKSEENPEEGRTTPWKDRAEQNGRTTPWNDTKFEKYDELLCEILVDNSNLIVNNNPVNSPPSNEEDLAQSNEEPYLPSQPVDVSDLTEHINNIKVPKAKKNAYSSNSDQENSEMSIDSEDESEQTSEENSEDDDYSSSSVSKN